MNHYRMNVKNCVRAAFAMFALATLSGCVSPYIDSQLQDVAPAKIASPQPVQVIFEFQTKGVTSGAATDMVRPTVMSALQDSGLFSQISDGPVPNGALLHIVINNVPLSDDAYAKGFVTGFTFGIVGNTVGDGYICSFDYKGGPNGKMISKEVRDAIYTSLGATAQPQHAEPMPDLKTAALTMAKRVVDNGLNEIAQDPGFGK